MSHRTQLILEDEQYARLQAEAAVTGVSLAELVRRAVDHTYGRMSIEEKLAAVAAAFGLWLDRDETGVADLRRPLADKVDQLWSR